jgi:hypothetical protein
MMFENLAALAQIPFHTPVIRARLREVRMLAVAECAIATDSGRARRRLLGSRIAARPWHPMAGAIDVIPTITRLRGKNNTADDEHEWDCQLNHGSHLAHVRQDWP